MESDPVSYRRLFETSDGMLLADVTDDPKWQAEYRRRAERS